MSKLAGSMPNKDRSSRVKGHFKTLADSGKSLMSRMQRSGVNSSGNFGVASGHESIKSPNHEKVSPFEFTGTQIPKRDLHFDADRLVQRPSYRSRRHKFDITKVECVNEKNNDPMTM
jgi:hypothetical protein